MTINTGDSLPDVTFSTPTEDGPKPISSQDVFAGKTVVLFAVPGAFTPTCSARHLPGYKDQASALKAKGVDAIVCTSVNDAFVMKAWAKDQNIGDEIVMLGDGNGDFAKAVGLTMDGSQFGMGLRSQRYALIARDGVVEKLFVEAPGEFKVSAADYVLENI
ncbi:peroxiredoxin [Asticcacaulis machinosus]|uniref:Glutathione-dependent peroxiredoxin n=1 Tax=Asticcacaulis machinosus TaxID=2984211 RepID=A0ABT5HFS0_9CAUL|nr:peroxiredoxin [Asticcacaulis machinosus]MDC7674951.1 peroxiredoxin [Asticcacaulis machinosus]